MGIQPPSKVQTVDQEQQQQVSPPQLFRTRTHLCVIQHPQLIQLFFRCHSAGPDVVAHDLPLTSSQNLKRSSDPGVLEVVSWRWGDAARSCEPSPSIQLTLRSPNQSVFRLHAQSYENDAQKRKKEKKTVVTVAI